MDLSHAHQFQNAFKFYHNAAKDLEVFNFETMVGLTSIIFTGDIDPFRKFKVEVGSSSGYVTWFCRGKLMGDRRCDTPDQLIKFMDEVIN